MLVVRHLGYHYVRTVIFLKLSYIILILEISTLKNVKKDLYQAKVFIDAAIEFSPAVSTA